jgi:hypothetical protein
MAGIYGVAVGLICHDTHSKFNTDWFSYSKVDKRDGDRQHGDIISLLLIFKIRIVS